MFDQRRLVFLMSKQLMRQSKSYQNCRWLLPPCFHGSSFSSATHERLESQGSGKHTTRTDRTPQDILQCLDLNVMYVQLLILRNTCQHESYSITRTILGKEEDPILSRSIVVPRVPISIDDIRWPHKVSWVLTAPTYETADRSERQLLFVISLILFRHVVDAWRNVKFI